ncbi:hypothetical protein TNCV_135541 [Trichonephila clavipes]|nr:hypothetical protein TNCV_135541 [Trichonephila clavipes]
MPITQLFVRAVDHSEKWLATLTGVSKDLAASLLVKLVAGDERWEAPDPPTGCSTSKLWWNRVKSYCHLYGAQGYGKRQAYI